MAAAEPEYVWMRALSDTAGGTLSGKRKIELETYVQMAYFDRILRRANLRLMTMSSGQYELKRQEEGDNKKEKAGLELNVIDHYNGTERSVKTLSGGESFQASLSLALGLSDEIQSYAGGIRLDAMFAVSYTHLPPKQCPLPPKPSPLPHQYQYNLPQNFSVRRTSVCQLSKAGQREGKIFCMRSVS